MPSGLLPGASLGRAGEGRADAATGAGALAAELGLHAGAEALESGGGGPGVRATGVARLAHLATGHVDEDGLLGYWVKNNSFVTLQAFNLKFLCFHISSDYIIILMGWRVFVGGIIVGLIRLVCEPSVFWLPHTAWLRVAMGIIL